jgi:hypothetical protein
MKKQSSKNPHANLTCGEIQRIENLLVKLSSEFTPAQVSYFADYIERLGWGTNWTGPLPVSR